MRARDFSQCDRRQRTEAFNEFNNCETKTISKYFCSSVIKSTQVVGSRLLAIISGGGIFTKGGREFRGTRPQRTPIVILI